MVKMTREERDEGLALYERIMDEMQGHSPGVA
jgi:hypothetical protein